MITLDNFIIKMWIFLNTLSNMIVDLDIDENNGKIKSTSYTNDYIKHCLSFLPDSFNQAKIDLPRMSVFWNNNRIKNIIDLLNEARFADLHFILPLCTQVCVGNAYEISFTFVQNLYKNRQVIISEVTDDDTKSNNNNNPIIVHFHTDEHDNVRYVEIRKRMQITDVNLLTKLKQVDFSIDVEMNKPMNHLFSDFTSTTIHFS